MENPPSCSNASPVPSEGSSLVSTDLSIDLGQLQKSPVCPTQEKFNNQCQSPKWPFQDFSIRVGLNRSRLLFNIFKWSLIAFNGILIFTVLAGMFVYYSEFRDRKHFNFAQFGKDAFSNDFSSDRMSDDNLEMASGPKYTWVASMFTFAFLLVIPCVGFIGAIKEHSCLLILYGVIFFVNAVVVLIFKSPWFLISASIASASLGLVFLIRNTAQTNSSYGINSKDVVKWHVSSV